LIDSTQKLIKSKGLLNRCEKSIINFIFIFQQRGGHGAVAGCCSLSGILV